MSEKKGHYYPRISEIGFTLSPKCDDPHNWQSLAAQGLLILAHIADRLGDLVLAIEEHTRATAYPDLEL